MFRQRLTITFEPELLQAVDEYIDGSAIRNRSHAIEDLVRHGLSLHEVTQAILTVTELAPEHIPQFSALCQAIGITTLHLVRTTAAQNLATDLAERLAVESAGKLTINQVPGEFGDGGALILLKNTLSTSFLLVQWDHNLLLPQSLIPALAFHQRHPQLATQLLATTNGTSYQARGLTLVKPELIAEIPAGQVSLREVVFPALLKKGTIQAYGN